jgi:hypothetical protein
MTLLKTDALTQVAFSVFENKGVFALLLGSGLSRAAGIPTGWEITLDLIRRIGLAQGITEQTDWAEWYRLQTGASPNYSTVIEDLGLSADERRSILHSYIEPTDSDREKGTKIPTKAHLAIAELVRAGYIKVIITPNFDRLMENALREREVEPTIVSSVDALVGAEPISHSKCYLLKLHGDYKDARILNTDAELSGYPDDYNKMLDRIFDEYGLIVAGWSGEWDQGLRTAFLRTVNRRYTVFWAARGKIGEAASELIIHRKAKVIPINGADSFFTQLQQKIEILHSTQTQNPRSVDLLVRSTKQYLGKPEYRIQLDDLFATETEQSIRQVEAASFNPNGPISDEEFKRRVLIYQHATESLARMAGVLGRWGTGSDLQLLIDSIQTIVAHAEKNQSGIVVLLGLQTYPAVLVFTAYSIGLTRAQRWPDLHKLFSTEIRSGHNKTRLIETLFLDYWAGSDVQYWRRLRGTSQYHTPLSDQLCDLMESWGYSFTAPTPDAALLFERMELLSSLAALEASPEADLRTTLEQPNRRDHVWTAVGRVIWDSQRKDDLLAEMKTTDRKSALLRAGFANGSESFLELFELNFGRIAGRLRIF